MKRSSGEKAPVASSSRSQTERGVSCREGRRLACSFRRSNASPSARRLMSSPPHGGMSVAVFIYYSSFENADRKLRDARANLQNTKVAAIIRVGKGRRKEASREKIVIEQLKKLIRELSAFCSDVLRLAARLEREARAELNFTARSGRLGDCA